MTKVNKHNINDPNYYLPLHGKYKKYKENNLKAKLRVLFDDSSFKQFRFISK